MKTLLCQNDAFFCLNKILSFSLYFRSKSIENSFIYNEHSWPENAMFQQNLKKKKNWKLMSFVVKQISFFLCYVCIIIIIFSWDAFPIHTPQHYQTFTIQSYYYWFLWKETKFFFYFSLMTTSTTTTTNEQTNQQKETRNEITKKKLLWTRWTLSFNIEKNERIQQQQQKIQILNFFS